MPADDLTAPMGSQARIRPFVLTSGRVAAGAEFVGLETQVVAHGPRTAPGLTPEMSAILSLCAEPVSVAEISALVPLQFGVARILVTDLNSAGFVDVYSTDEDMSRNPELIMRVIRGLRNL